MSGTDLHLPNLTIRRFRGIQDLSIECLGRVTLIAGRNGVGKTTVLDAVRTYAARGHYAGLTSILREREGVASYFDEGGEEVLVPVWEALFHGRRNLLDNPIVIGPTGSDQFLKIEVTPANAEEVARWERNFPEDQSDEDTRVLRVTFAGKEQTVPLIIAENRWLQRAIARDSKLKSGIRCESLGPSVLENSAIARLWDKVALTDDENRAVEALRLIFVKQWSELL